MDGSQTGVRSRPAAASGDYDPGPIEERWRLAWAAQDAFAVPAPQDEREPAYVFARCPVTSGDAHVGQLRSYVIADAYARYLRARGRAVLFSMGFDAFGLPTELAALRREMPPQEWVERCRQRMRAQFERLGCSCDWERTFVSSEPAHYRWTQWLFLALLERDLIYERDTWVGWCDSCQTVVARAQADDGRCWRCQSEVRFARRAQWFLRTTAYLTDNENGLNALAGWSEAAIGSQRTALGRVDGVELEAGTFDGGGLTVFSDHPKAIPDAAFIAVSPAHPDVERWLGDPKVAERVQTLRVAARRGEEDEAEPVQIVQTGALATVPSVAGMLPIVISPHVDARFGATAVLGIPAADPTDRAIAEGLPAPSGGTWKAAKSDTAARPAVRYHARDFPISRPRAWGAPIPLVHCAACGAVPVPVEQLPVRLPGQLQLGGEDANPLDGRPDFYDCACPRCEGPGKRETDTIDSHLDEMWMWVALCVPPEDRPGAMFNHPEHARWLPADQVVWGADAGDATFDERILAKILEDLGELPTLPDREPFAGALMPGAIHHEGRRMSKHLGNGVDPDGLVEQLGADTMRLALLYAASPEHPFNWNEQPLLYSRRFLETLHGYAEPRLREWGPLLDGAARIDTSEKLRRRLANWCSVAREKVTAELEQLRMQRAAHDAMRLLTRIQDFEQRTLQRRGELQDADREAILAALILLTQLLAPLTPHIAEELWSLTGSDTLVSSSPWPAQAVDTAGWDVSPAVGGDA